MALSGDDAIWGLRYTGANPGTHGWFKLNLPPDAIGPPQELHCAGIATRWVFLEACGSLYASECDSPTTEEWPTPTAADKALAMVLNIAPPEENEAWFGDYVLIINEAMVAHNNEQKLGRPVGCRRIRYHLPEGDKISRHCLLTFDIIRRRAKRVQVQYKRRNDVWNEYEPWEVDWRDLWETV